MPKKWIFLLILSLSLSACSEELLNQLLEANAASSTQEQSNSSEEPATNESPQPSEASAATGTPLHQEILALVNQERQKNGAPALKLNTKLSKAAQGQAENMIATGIFAHEIGGKNVGDRATAAGYSWGRIGENIASGQTSATEVMDTWMNSEGHRKNILNAQFQELGVGYAEAEDGTPYWVQVFGTPF